MNHEPFNWKKFLARLTFIPGLFLIAIGIIWSIIFPDRALLLTPFYDVGGPNSYNVFMAISWLIICAIILVLIYILVIVWIAERISFFSSTESTALVKVISKTHDTSVRRVKGVPIRSTRHFISFEFQDGSRKTIPVNVSQFGIIIENEIGILTYREYGTQYLWFVKFQRQV